MRVVPRGPAPGAVRARAAAPTATTRTGGRRPRASTTTRPRSRSRGAHAAAACASCHAAGAGRRRALQGHAAPDLRVLPSRPARGPHGRRAATPATAPPAGARIEPGRFDHVEGALPADRPPREGGLRRLPRAGPGGVHEVPGHSVRRPARAATRIRTRAAWARGAPTCHTTAGWQRVQRRDAFDHGRTRFPLQGRARRASSASPATGPGRPRRRCRTRACTDCHADRHAGQLAGRADGGPLRVLPRRGRASSPRASRPRTTRGRACRSRARTWPCPATPAIARSRRLERGCVPPGGAPARTEQLRFASTGCASATRTRTAGARRAGACETCHATAAWSAVTFDHARRASRWRAPRRRLPLLPSRPRHAGLRGAGLRRLPPGPARRPLRASGRTDCARCHEPALARARFDHDRDTSFPLQGAHRSVPCAACHCRQTAARCGTVDIGKACSACHGCGAEGPVPLKVG